MINFRTNDYDYKSKANRNPSLVDVTVDGTRVATLRSYRQAKAFRDAVETDLGYPCRSGTQAASFAKYYRKKYGYNDINV